MEPSLSSQMCASLFHFLDRHPGEFKGLTAQLIDWRAQTLRDETDAYSNAQRQRPHSPSQVKQEPGYLAELTGDGLKLIPGSHGIGQPYLFFLQMSNGR